MKGMTGYGYAEHHGAQADVVVEIKSWNNKFADINMNLPPSLIGLDERLRDLIRAKVLRGRVDVQVRYRSLTEAAAWDVDTTALEAAISCVQTIKTRVGDTTPILAKDILSLEGVLRRDQSRDIDGAYLAVEPVFLQALEQLEAHRRREGLATQADLRTHMELIQTAYGSIKDMASKLEGNFKDTIRRRFTEVLGDMVDEQRVLQEVAVMLVRYSIQEELERLGTHLAALKDLVEKGEGVAKRIDFLAQEMNREINTIGSKSVDSRVSALVVDCKTALDTIREQVRNIE